MNKNRISNTLLLSVTVLLSACQSDVQKLKSTHTLSKQNNNQSRLDLTKNFPNMTGNTDLKPYLKKNHWINLYASESPPPNSAINFNFNTKGENIRLNLNCANPNEKPFFLIEDADGVDVFSSDIDDDQRMEFVLDQQVFTNPFKDPESKNFEKFKQAFYQAKKLTIKTYFLSENLPEKNAQTISGVEYSFNNQYAEVLKEPSNHCDAAN